MISKLLSVKITISYGFDILGDTGQTNRTATIIYYVYASMFIVHRCWFCGRSKIIEVYLLAIAKGALIINNPEGP